MMQKSTLKISCSTGRMVERWYTDIRAGRSSKSGLLCYPKCRSGYSGVGPVCSNLAEGLDVMTVHFAQSQNRMVGCWSKPMYWL